MKTILKLENVNKSIEIDKNNQRSLLGPINLQIQEGEFVSIMGPSGSGKSTLLYHMSGMDKVTSGSVIFDGQELSSLSEQKLASLRLSKMGFIFQQIHLMKNLSIFDNIILSGYLRKHSSRKEINRRAIELMETMGISGLIDNDITEASGGQLQRAAICRSLINNPSILFGDEPTGALNSKFANDIMEILGNINQAGTTIVLATHDIKVAARTERVIYILDGNIVAERQLGKRFKNADAMQERERQLSEWLIQLGF